MHNVTEKGTIVPDMSTIQNVDKLGDAFFGKTRKAVLSLLFGHPDEEYYVRQIARLTGVGHGAMQRELAALHRAGIIARARRGNQVYYRVDVDCPVYREIRDFVRKTAGAGDTLRDALAPLADRIGLAFIYGSVARGEERSTSDIDVVVVGDVSFAEVSQTLRQAQDKLSREVNPTVYSQAELRNKLKMGHHFLTSVVKGEKIFLIGNQRELAKLVEKRLDRRA